MECSGVTLFDGRFHAALVLAMCSASPCAAEDFAVGPEPTMAASGGQSESAGGGFPDDGFPDELLPPPGCQLQEAGSGDEPANKDGGERLLNWQAAAFIKAQASRIRPDSLVNPDNRLLGLDDRRSYLETRFTLSDELGQDRATRWLFKGYTTTLRRDPSGSATGLRVDELFVDRKSPRWFATAGKRRVNWGHAQGFNPVNVVAPPRDPLDPSFQTEGQPMVWASYSNRATTDVILTRGNPSDLPGHDKYRWGVRWSMAGAEGDLALYVFDGQDYENGRAYERMLGASFSMTLAPGWTWYGEFANFSNNYRKYPSAQGVMREKGGGYSQIVTGFLADLGNRSSFFAELFLNEQGYTRNQRENQLDALMLAPGDPERRERSRDFVPLSMNKTYLLAGFRKEYREKYGASLSLLLAADRSYSGRAELSYALSDYYEIKSTYVRNSGKPRSEFGNSPYKDVFEIQFNASF